MPQETNPLFGELKAATSYKSLQMPLLCCSFCGYQTEKLCFRLKFL